MTETSAAGTEKRALPLALLDRLTWLTLANWRDSFFSKAVTALSISALFLANAAPLLAQHGIALPQMTRMFVGSALYLAGCAAFALRVPSQLSRGGEIYDIVSRMKMLTDWSFFDSYRDMAEKGSTRIAGHHIYPPDKKCFLTTRVDEAKQLTAETVNWIDQTAGLYQAFIEIRNYERPIARVVTAALLGAGTCILFWPVAVNIACAATGLFR